jgi:MFS family permease
VEFEGERRNRWISYATLVGTGASVFLLPLAGFLGKIDWRIPFALNLAVLILVALIAIGVREPQIRETEKQEAATSPVPWGPIVLGGLVGLVVGVQSLFIPFHLREVGIHDPNQISLGMVAGVLSGAIVAFLYAKVRRTLSIGATFTLGLAFLAAGLGVVGMAQNLATAIVGGLIAGVGVGVGGPNVFAYAASVGTERDRARNIGVARGAFLAAPMLGQILLEPVAHARGPGVALLVSAALALVGALSLRFISIERRPAVAA